MEKLEYGGFNFYKLKDSINEINYPLIDWCKQYLIEGYNMIDIGANSGSYSFLLHKSCHRVYAFECNPYTVSCLEEGIKKNHIENIIVDSNALSNTESENVFFNISFKDSRLDSFYNKLESVVCVNTKRLDSYSLEKISFIKMNTNGSELNILKGALETLKSNFYPPIVYHSQSTEVSDFLKKLGYEVFNISGCQDMYIAANHYLFKNKLKNVEGFEACEKAILSNNEHIRFQAMEKIYNYIKPIPYIKKIMLNCPMNPNRLPNNPSILRLENGDYLCNIRCLNYYTQNNHFIFMDININMSDHMLLTLSPDFMIKKTVQLIDKTNNIYYDSFVKGVDDLRLIDDHRFICVHGNFNTNRLVEQCLGTFNEKGEITKLIPLKGPNPWRHEKNWLPYIKDDELYIVYSFNPFTMYKVNEETGDLTLYKNITLVENFDMRGSASFIPYKGGLLATVHQSYNFSYMQRFIWMDYDFTVLKYSIPFYFQEKGLQYSMGMCHSDEGLILTNSIKETSPSIAIIDYAVVDSYLNL